MLERLALTVPWPCPLVAATFCARRDRFLADMVLESSGEAVEAHCVNPGRMEAFVVPGARCYLLPSANPKRRCRYTWELLEHTPLESGAAVLCGTNTQRPNAIAAAVLEARALPGLSAHAEVHAEMSLPEGGRCDFCLIEPGTSSHAARHWVEVKNCHMVYEDGWGYFPDSVSERAARHVRELGELALQGERATVLFVVQRADVRHGVRPSDHHDPEFARACREAGARGVEFRAIRAAPCLDDGVRVEAEIPVDLAEYDVAPIAAQCERNAPHTGWDRGFDGSMRRVANSPFAHNTPRTSTRQRGEQVRAVGASKRRRSPSAPAGAAAGAAIRSAQRVSAPLAHASEPAGPLSDESSVAAASSGRLAFTPSVDASGTDNVNAVTVDQKRVAMQRPRRRAANARRRLP